MSVDINGIAHVQLTVNDPVRSLPFWKALCLFLGMQPLIEGDDVVYCIGGRTGVLVKAAPEPKRGRHFDQEQVGLHHLCFRARSAEDVDAIHRFLVEELDAHIVHAPKAGPEFAPGYYSVLFEDPDGIRVEVNHVPGKGHFDGRGRLAPGGPGPNDHYPPRPGEGYDG